MVPGPEIKTSLRGVEQAELRNFIARALWGADTADGITMEDSSGAGGGMAFILTKPGAEPAKCVLKVSSAQSLSSLSSERLASATTLFQEHGLYPQPLLQGVDWSINPFIGIGVAKDRFHFDEGKAPLQTLAGLMAKIHTLPTDWYAPHRTKLIARDARISATLAGQPPHSHCWNPFAFGLENGMVFMGGGFPNPETAKEVMERQITCGVFQKFLSATAFHPVSAAGRRVVTVHGDFKADNVLLSEAGELVPIDFEFTCVGPAVNDLGFSLIAFLGGQWGVSYEKRHAYFTRYLEAAGLPASDEDARALMLDAEVNTVANFVGLLSNIYDGQVPLLRGSPHPTAKGMCETFDSPTGLEVIDLLASALQQVRASTQLSDVVVHNGIVPTLYNRLAGSEPLWKFLDELKQHNMLRLFGIR